MPEYPIVTNCYRCGSSQVTRFWDEVDGSVVMCWHCGHRVLKDPKDTKCPKCGNVDAMESFDDKDGVIILCCGCGHFESSGMILEIYPRATKCAQCGNPQACEFYDEYCTVEAVEILCRRCGHTEYTGTVVNDKEAEPCGWKHEVNYGAGFLQFRPKGQRRSIGKPLHTAKQVDDAERLVREKLAKGDYGAHGTYLTRWNRTSRQVEIVIGAPRSDPEFGSDTGQRRKEAKSPRGTRDSQNHNTIQ